MTIWRICPERYARQAFDGEGARRYGGRWNPPGYPVVYTSDSLALAALETFVNLNPDRAPDRLVAIRAEIPAENAIRRISVADLPADWRDYPAPESLRILGAGWFGAADSAVLGVPSAVIPVEWNYLLNPAHPQFATIVIHPPDPFEFDARMWKSGR